MIKKMFFASTILFLSTPLYAELTIRLSSNEVPFGSPVSLILESNEEIKQPDLTNLETKVRIQGTSQSSNIRIINGSMSKLHKISFTLFPLKKGEVELGPFTIDGKTYQPLKLNVIDSSIVQPEKIEVTTNVEHQLKLPEFEASINRNKIYEGQFAIYETKFYETAPTKNVQIIPPKINNLTFSLLENDEILQEKKGEEFINVFKRYFVVTPSSSGDFNIPPAELSGNIIIPVKNTHNHFDPFFQSRIGHPFFLDNSKPFFIPSKAINLNVQKKPDNWTGWWFPSNQVQLNEEYKIPEKIYTGDVIERKIFLTASDVENAKLPLIEIKNTPDFTIFPNPEERYTFFEKGELKSIENRTFLLIPQKEGELTIPEISIKYFNTTTEKEDFVTLPEKKIQVFSQQVTPSKSQTPPETPPKQSNNAPTKKTSTNYILFLWMGIISFVIICISAIILFVLRHKQKNKNMEILELDKKQKTKKKKKPLPDLYPF